MIAKITEEMIHFYKGSVHDIEHFLKVHAYARLIGLSEGLDTSIQETLEIAAVVHDISCPMLREKYGYANGKLQEETSEEILRPFLHAFDIDKSVAERIIRLVSRHHTTENVDGIDHQILLEADFLVNASEGRMEKGAVRRFRDEIAKTDTGKRLLDSIYRLNEYK
ncbi:MAG: HD domain-containing protein [Clostridia bacterium]|nr:HD domain-containing protein [Clostridia bacterium]MBQ4619166.1 HD domain-containing protein [Clostridia bacterium]